MKLRVVALSVLAGLAAGAAGANINNEMHRQFGAMTNVTAPAVIVGPEGGVVSAGGLRMRMPVRSVTPTRITPPSIRAGCGGIDLQGGSLSFPSAQEFIQVARAVAGNVGGYAFKLALGNICQPCENIMSEIQELNNLFNKADLDSCQMAEGIVDSMRDGPETAAEARLREVGTAFKQAFSSDTLEASQVGEDTAPVADMSPEERRQAFQGNYIWDALTRNGPIFEGMADNQEMKEVLMSMIGTFVMCAEGLDGCVDDPSKAREGEGTGDSFGRQISLTDLLEGGQRTILTCSDAQYCLNVQARPRDLGKSMEQRLEEAFLGASGGSGQKGIIDKLTDTGAESEPLTTEQLQWMAFLGPHQQTLVNIAKSGRHGREHAREWIRTGSRGLVAHIYADMIDEVIRSVRMQVQMETRPGKQQALEILAEAEQALARDLAGLQTRENSLFVLMHGGQTILASQGPRRIVVDATRATVAGVTE